MKSSGDGRTRYGISAVVTAGEGVTDQILDLAAVLSGLVDDQFEIIVLSGGETHGQQVAEEMRVRAPGLPLRLLAGQSAVAGCEAAGFDLILLASADGRFDVSELNRLFDAIERGADLAAGYRPRRVDPIVRGLRRLGLNLSADRTYQLFRTDVWRAAAGDLGPRHLRRLGYRIAEIPVSQARPATGPLVSGASRAA